MKHEDNPEKETLVSRRQFNLKTAKVIGGALMGITLSSCKKKKPEPEIMPEPTAVEPPPETHTKTETVFTYLEETETTFPHFEVSGKPYDIGYAIGNKFADKIRKGFELRGKWWKDLKEFADSQPDALYDTFVAAAKKHTPSVYEELRGWAEGSGVPLRDLVVLNLKAEYGALKDLPRAETSSKQPGCSTIVVSHGKKIIIAHNEDGNDAYLENMFMLKVKPEGKTSFFCASYPGILPGNAPWVNDKGIIMTTNFIYTKEVKKGVGRYFLDRLAMEANTLDETLEICKHPERAYAYHHVIGSAKDKRVISLEVTPSNHEQLDISGVFIHTNHLVAPSLTSQEQDKDYVSSSSMTRWKILSKWKEKHKEAGKVTQEDILEVLTSHEGKPYSPCRHPEGDIRGATLLTALFDAGEKTMQVYKKQPCRDTSYDYAFPT